MGRTLSRVAGVVFAGALITFAATPAALAQDETSTSPTETSTSTSETTTSSGPASTTPETTAPSSTAPAGSSQPGDVKTTEKRVAPEKKAEPEQKKEDTQEPPKDEDDYQDGVGHGFVGLGGEGILVVNCASGKVGGILSQNLSVTSGPDQDESDGRLWNYSVTVSTPPTGPTARFAFTCDGVEGIGIVDFEQEQQPPTSTTPTSVPSSTAPVTTPSVPSTTTGTTTTTTTAPGNAAPKAQVKVAPKGGIETGFGGMAW